MGGSVEDACEPILFPPPLADPRCPCDGRYQFNTLAVFDERGALLAKAHKAHLFGEAAALDAADALPPAVFTTSFGVTFGAIICFDIEFAQPAQALLAAGVRDFVYASWWQNSQPANVGESG